MRMGLIGDIHGQTKHLQKLIKNLEQQSLDFVCLSGDLGGYYLSYRDTDDWTPTKNKEHRASFKYTKSLRNILFLLNNLKCPIFYVPGNHDYSNLDEIFDFIKSENPDLQNLNIQNLDGKVIEYKDIVLAGKGGAPNTVAMPYGFDDDDPPSQEEIDRWNQCDIFLSHCPPLGILDGRRYGSKKTESLLSVDVELKHRLYLCGHIHENFGHGEIREINVTFVNGGSLGPPYVHVLQNIIEFTKNTPPIIQMSNIYKEDRR